MEELLVLLAIGQPIQVLASTVATTQNGYFALTPFQLIYTLLSIRNGRVHVDKTGARKKTHTQTMKSRVFEEKDILIKIHTMQAASCNFPNFGRINGAT